MGRTKDSGKEIILHQPPSPDIIEKVMMHGDLTALSVDQRLAYYKSVCNTLGLNPLTKPFDYIILDGKLVLYARKDCTEQLRKRYQISLSITHRERQDSIYTVTAQAALGDRVDESIGAVSIITKEGKQLQGTALANSVMKAETKAKRRVTLSICGLGMLDESELETVRYGEYDQRSESEIAARRVKQATANATGENVSPAIPSGENEYGPLVVTQDNYREVKSHVGQASGNLLGRKVGELHSNVIKWLHDVWRNRLNPSSTDQDMRLKAAIELAYSDVIEKDKRAGDAADVITDQQPTVNPTEAAKAATRDLRERIQDLVLTEDQAIGYLRQQGVFAAGWTQLEHAPESILLYLSTPEGWDTFKRVVEADVKPKPVAAKAKKKR